MEGCPKPSISVLKNSIFHCGYGQMLGRCPQGLSSKIREKPWFCPKITTSLPPSPASWAKNPATRGQGAPGGGGGDPEPKTLPQPKDYDLGLYFSYAKGGPSTDVVVKKADVRWPVQDRR